MMSTGARDPAFDKLPPIATALSRSEWAATVGTWAFLAISSADGLANAARAQGVHVSKLLWAVGALLVIPLWAVLAPTAFRALDALPVRAGARLRNIALRVLVLFALNAVVGIVARLALQLVVPLLHLDPALLGLQELSWRAAVFGPFDGVLAVLLAHVILQRIHRSRNRQLRAAELETSLARARLDALAKEVQPHFLFNTLNGIAALVRDDPVTAEAMLVKLGDMLRISVDSVSDGEIALGDELARLQLYLDLQRMRFGPRLTIAVRAEQDVLGARVPAMLLQPLVENAVVHGLASRPGPGTVSVEVVRHGERLQLTVSDDGIGLPGTIRESTGIGNTRSRLHALHGDDARLALAPRAGGSGTVVTIELPLREAPVVLPEPLATASAR